MKQQSLILALDYGGTKHTVGIAARGEREWLAKEAIYSPADADACYDQAAMLELARKLLARMNGRLAGVGASFGGAVDGAAGMVKLSHHVPGWDNTPLREQLRLEFKVPAAIDNDAHCGALGEYAYGAGRDCASLLYVTVSTGVGGGWILHGQIVSGADGMAGQIGHVVVNPGGVLCVCGKRGCVEAEACGPAIAKKMRAKTGAGPDAPITCEAVARAALSGDQAAQEVIAEAATMLGAGLGGAIALMNPERVILAGGVTKSGESWWETVRATARQHALPEMKVDIQPAALGDDAPLWGAVALIQPLL